MASQSVKGSGSTVNDGGTIVKGGSIGADSPMTKNISIAELADGPEGYGSKVVKVNNPTDKDYKGVIEAKGLGTGTFAFSPNAQEGERNFLIRGAGTAGGNNEINNTASDVLVSPASEVALRGVSDIHAITSTVQIGEDDATFNVLARPSTDMVPGRAKGTDAGVVSTFVDPATGSATSESAILPTRAVPGELTYHFGAVNAPKTDEYKAKDSHE